MQLLHGLSAREGIAIGLRRQGESVRHLDAAFPQGAIEFAQGRRLAAYARDIAEANIPEPADASIRLGALFRFLLHCNKPRRKPHLRVPQSHNRMLGGCPN